jgi:hypothetical protein
MYINVSKNEEKILVKLKELSEEKKKNVLDFIDFLKCVSKIPKGKRESEEYSYWLEELRKKIELRGGLYPGKTEEEILQDLRRTRETIWNEDYEDHFRHK